MSNYGRYAFLIGILHIVTIISSEVNEKYVKCDFDLVAADASIKKHLPDACQNITEGSSIFAAMVTESQRFAEFHDQLEQYEADQDGDYVAGTEDMIPTKLWGVRDDLYAESNIYECFNSSDSQEVYTNCLITKRNELVARLMYHLSDPR